MVERSQTAGWLPSLYEPIKKVGQKIADWFAPRSDAAMTRDAYVITMELPGVQPNNIDVSLQDNMLVITGDKQTEHEESDRSYFFSEREFGVFQRAFRIPADAQPAAIEADFKNGLLTIKIPKLAAIAGPSKKVLIRSE
jgi:HSP20 family protein